MISGNFSYSISKSCSGCRDVITIPIEKDKITAVLIQEEGGGGYLYDLITRTHSCL